MARLCGILGLVVGVTLANGGGPVPSRHGGEVAALAFSPDGKALFSVGLDGLVCRWDGATGTQKANALAHQGGTHALAVSADGKYLVTAGADNLVKLWDAATLAVLRTFEGHRNEVLAVALSPDGTLLASGGGDKTIRIWDTATGKPVRHFHGHELKVTGLAFAPDGKSLASGGTSAAVIPGFFVGASHADEVRLWDPHTGKELRKLPLRGLVVAFAPDGRSLLGGGMVITGTQNGKSVSIHGGAQVCVAPADGGKEELLVKGQGAFGAFSADGKFLVTSWGHRRHLMSRFNFENEMKHQMVSVWELATGKEVVLVRENVAPVAAFAPDGRKLAVGRINGVVVLIDLVPGRAKDKHPELAVEEGERCWKVLASEDAKVAYEQMWALILAGDKAVTLLGDRLQPVEPAGAVVKELLAKLDSKRFAVRE
ncbi:MAG TPA: WD40 repeat domain-containing protein, partial [Gemmataceae bacterium]|nr:WD40 repeat domain-containing protein [Gemmataceae bacterium]